MKIYIELCLIINFFFDFLLLFGTSKILGTKFTYDNIAINLTYLSNGDELFFYIQDRPTNRLNAPFMLFKCNLDARDKAS